LSGTGGSIKRCDVTQSHAQCLWAGVWCDWEFSESWDKSLDEFFESGFQGWDGIDEAIVHIASSLEKILVLTLAAMTLPVSSLKKINKK